MSKIEEMMDEIIVILWNENPKKINSLIEKSRFFKAQEISHRAYELGFPFRSIKSLHKLLMEESS